MKRDKRRTDHGVAPQRLRVIWAFLVRDFQTEISYRFSFLISLSSVVFSSFTYYFVSQLIGERVIPALAVYEGDYFAFALIGVAFSNYFSVGLAGFARALREAQTTGTLEALMMTPTSVSTVILGSAGWSYAFTTIRVVVYLVLGLLLGLRVGDANYGAAIVTLVVAIISFASIGIIAAGTIMVVKRGDPVTALLGGFATLLGGVFYPVEILPPWLQFVARFLPLTYANRAMRLALLNGAPWSQLQTDILVLLGFALTLFPLSLVVFHYAVERARKDGSLAHY